MITTAACGSHPDAGAHIETETTEAGVVAGNGLYLNGPYLNGVYLNGVYLNGVYLNGVYLNGPTQQAATVEDVVLEGSMLTGRVNGQRRRGANLVGTIFHGSASDGGTLAVRIDSFAEATPNDPAHDVFAYGVSVRRDGTNAWMPLCGVDAAGAPIAAIPVAGRWDYRIGVPGGGAKINDPGAITFGCRGTAIAKCVEMGYKPWRTQRVCEGLNCRDVPLANHHQACTRLIRADYCGDGTPHTSNGRRINVYDGININGDTELLWLIEAEWDADGARCVSVARRQLLNFPSCYVERVTDNLLCGSRARFRSGTALMNEIVIE